jgi:hypothetical protein
MSISALFLLSLFVGFLFFVFGIARSSKEKQETLKRSRGHEGDSPVRVQLA